MSATPASHSPTANHASSTAGAAKADAVKPGDAGPKPENPMPVPDLITVTLNPALDVSTSTPAVMPDHKLRCGRARREPGGGGINVARVAQRLGLHPRAVLTTGGQTGRALLEIVRGENLNAVAVPVEGETRQSFTVTEDATDQHYRFVLPGPQISHETVAAVGSQIGGEPPDAPVVISGSVPPGLEPGDFAAFVSQVVAMKPTVIVDTSGPALREALTTEVSLVKPSARELGNLVDRQLYTESEILYHAQSVLESSRVKALLVSIGAGGAILIERGAAPERFRAPTVRVQSAVGAGDSLVAGTAVGLVRGEPLRGAVALGIAAGTAAVMTPGSQLCEPERVYDLLASVTHQSAANH